MVFEAPDTHYPLDDDRIWASIVPPKRGFLRLGPDGTPFSLALYHQLHCVNGIRFAYVASRDGLFKTEKMRAESFGHVNHCFDVLRQSLMCKADTTLMLVGASNTTSVTRRCRDWTQVRDFVGSNHAFWRDVPYTPPPEATQPRPKSAFFSCTARSILTHSISRLVELYFTLYIYYLAVKCISARALLQAVTPLPDEAANTQSAASN